MLNGKNAALSRNFVEGYNIYIRIQICSLDSILLYFSLPIKDSMNSFSWQSRPEIMHIQQIMLLNTKDYDYNYKEKSIQGL